MSVNKKQCAFCKAILFDDDDVVFCPDCGAPHHRECYNSLGRCANEHRHGIIDEESENDVNNHSEAAPTDREGHVCSACGKISSSDTLFCPYCNHQFIEADSNGQAPHGTKPPFSDPYGNVEPNSEINGVAVSDIASYVMVNTHRYVPKFKALSSRKSKNDWNWGGCVFTYAWLMYRKCHLEAIATMLFTLVSYMMMSPVYLSYYRAILPFTSMNEQELASAGTELTRAVFESLSTLGVWAWVLFACGIALNLVIHIVIGLRADSIYMNKVIAQIKKIHADNMLTDKHQFISLSGGVNPILFLISTFAMNIIFNYIITSFML